MDEKKVIKLRVLERTEETIEEKIISKPKYPNQTNPIFKNLAKFTNAKIGDKWSINDLLR